jgi:hypothetical protein
MENYTTTYQKLGKIGNQIFGGKPQCADSRRDICFSQTCQDYQENRLFCLSQNSVSVPFLYSKLRMVCYIIFSGESLGIYGVTEFPMVAYIDMPTLP